VLVFDYRGIGDSSDNLNVEPTMAMHANDLIALLDHLQWQNVHMIGLIGMGCCVAQELAIHRPDLVRSMVNMGAWAYCDSYLCDQLKLFRDVHRDSGFFAFQKFVSMYSFLPEYYRKNRDRLLGPDGGWKELNNNYPTHERLVEACLNHDVRGRLEQIEAPCLIIHAAKDLVTGPRTTLLLEQQLPNAQGVMMEEVAHVVAGREQKIAFCKILFSFLHQH
jgi:pimeloyl-ACP methyl ester carboxylesterase